jgi:DNA-binding LacI/PurR family transcriptional regulator
VQADGVSSFVTDSEDGMRAIVRHLIEAHGCQKIAFVRGISGQAEAEQRFRAYKDELRNHNIPLDEALIVEGDFTQESGRAAVRTLLDERGVRFQAVACSNDRMAFGVMEVLEQRGIKVPDSVAVTGFDDINEAQSMGVPLTTVRQSFYEAGTKAFEALLKKIEGAQIDAVNLLSSSLIIRWSCGCLPESIKRLSFPKKWPILAGLRINAMQRFERYSLLPAFQKRICTRIHFVMFLDVHGMYFSPV